MSLAGQVGHTSYPSRISVPSRGFCFLGKHNLENVVRLGSAFLAGALVLWDKRDLEKVVRLGSAFLAGAFVFWENTTWEKAVRLGSAFLAGAFPSWENTTWNNQPRACTLGMKGRNNQPPPPPKIGGSK